MKIILPRAFPIITLDKTLKIIPFKTINNYLLITTRKLWAIPSPATTVKEESAENQCLSLAGVWERCCGQRERGLPDFTVGSIQQASVRIRSVTGAFLGVQGARSRLTQSLGPEGLHLLTAEVKIGRVSCSSSKSTYRCKGHTSQGLRRGRLERSQGSGGGAGPRGPAVPTGGGPGCKSREARSKHRGHVKPRVCTWKDEAEHSQSGLRWGSAGHLPRAGQCTRVTSALLPATAHFHSAPFPHCDSVST